MLLPGHYIRASELTERAVNHYLLAEQQWCQRCHCAATANMAYPKFITADLIFNILQLYFRNA